MICSACRCRETTKNMDKTKHIINEMKVFYDGSHKPGFDMRAENTQKRTERQEIWDSAVLATAEFVRRFDDYDEKRALQICELLSTKLPR